jgi:hypothetical protein
MIVWCMMCDNDIRWVLMRRRMIPIKIDHCLSVSDLGPSIWKRTMNVAIRHDVGIVIFWNNRNAFIMSDLDSRILGLPFLSGSWIRFFFVSRIWFNFFFQIFFYLINHNITELVRIHSSIINKFCPKIRSFFFLQ